MRRSASFPRGFQVSRNHYNWLGDGAYFFQDSPVRAREWARQRFGEQAAVVGAEIDLGDCIDLLDVPWHAQIARVYPHYIAECEQQGRPLPRQSAGAHRLDRDVMNYLIDVLEEENTVVSGVRAAFSEGEPAFPGSALLNQSHVQIAIRAPGAIVRSWRET